VIRSYCRCGTLIERPVFAGQLCRYCKTEGEKPMNEPNHHTILGDLAAVIEQHGGSWRIEREHSVEASIPRLWRVTWSRPSPDMGAAAHRVSVVRPSIQAAAAAVLACIDHFTRPDGGLDL
jgi:hypothetical protein